VFLSEKKKSPGAVEIVDIYMKEKKHLKHVRPVRTPEPILSYWAKTGNSLNI
jgi:hypothetical protein